MLLANRYGLFDPTFFNNLSGINLLQCDLLILNSIVREENEAVEANRKKSKERQEHPGMERFESVDDFWDEAERARRGED